MTTQQSDRSQQQQAAHEVFRQRSAQVNAAVREFTESKCRLPADREIAALVRETRPDKIVANEIPPDARDEVREYYVTICLKTLVFVVLYVGFLFALLALAACLALRLGWISPDMLGP